MENRRPGQGRWPPQGEVTEQDPSTPDRVRPVPIIEVGCGGDVVVSANVQSAVDGVGGDAPTPQLPHLPDWDPHLADQGEDEGVAAAKQSGRSPMRRQPPSRL